MATDTKTKDAAEAVFGGDMLRKAEVQDMNLNQYKDFDFDALKEQSEQVVAPGAVDKSSLIGVPFVIVGWDTYYSEKNQVDFVKCAVITENKEGKVFVDSGVAIRPILEAFKAERGIKPIYCPEGLRASTYDARVDPETGEKKPGGTTYYLT